MQILTEIGIRHKTDKATWHKYTDIYEIYFKSLRKNKIKLLEIGIFQGASLKMWHEYFPNGMIYGIDNCSIDSSIEITPETIKKLENNRIKTFICDQSERDQLKSFIKEFDGDFDIIIDDGLHFQEHQQISWGFLFPYIKSGGVYVIEDLCPSNRTKPGWGLKDFIHFHDNTTDILKGFAESKKIVSPYMIEKEMIYLNHNIKEIKIYQVENEQSIIAFIKKE